MRTPRGYGRGARGGRGGYGYGNRGYAFDENETLQELGKFIHPCEGEMVYRSSIENIPYFNAPVFLENKQQIGKIGEVFGRVNEVYFSVKPEEGVVAQSFKTGDAIFISSSKLLPLDRFLNGDRRTPSGSRGRGRGRGRGGFRGGRGDRGFRGSGRGFRGGGFRGGGRGAPGRGRPRPFRGRGY